MPRPVLLAAALLAGCAVGPSFQRPAAPDARGYTPAPLPAVTAAAPITGGEAQSFAPGRDVPADWWTLFGNEDLRRLVERALAANPNIVVATANLNQAQALVRAQAGLFAPVIGANYNISRQQIPGNMAGNASPGIQGSGRFIGPKLDPTQPPYTQGVTFTLHTASLSVGYQPDLFGGVRRGLEAARATRDAQRYALEAATVTLATNVVAAAIQEAALREEIAAVREIVAANEEGLRILRVQQGRGSASGLDVAAQETALANARALLPPLNRQLEQTRDLIRVLAGNTPDMDVPETFTLARLRLPTDLPVSVPSDLVNQRPDIRIAEEQLRLASAGLGIAIANRLPVVNLTAGGGGLAAMFEQMFRQGGPFWAAVGSVSQTVFDGFSLYNQQAAAREAMVGAAAQYRATVLTAFQNVADVLQALVADAEAVRTAGEAEAAARRALELTRAQNRMGLVNGLALLNAQAAFQQAVLTRVQAQATRYGDTAALYQALGGGWWNRPRGT